MDEQILYKKVMQGLENNTKVSPEDARRFLNNVFYGGFAQIDPALDKGGLAGLPLEFKLTLYESIAQEPNNPRVVPYLEALNESLELTDGFYTRFQASVVEFLSPDSLDGFGAKFTHAYQASLLNNATPQTKATVLAVLANQYCTRNDVIPPVLKFYSAEPENKGYSSGDEIGININSPEFQNYFAGTINTLFHEITHKRAASLGTDYVDGKIGADHPDYIAARVFAATQLTPGGYISPDANHAAYERQPIEVHARTIGEAAENAVMEGIAANFVQPALPRYFASDEFFTKLQTSVVEFFSPESLNGLGAGFMRLYQGSLENNASSPTKIMALELLMAEYCARNNIPSPALNFYKAAPDKKGYSSVKEDEIGINLNSPEFQQNFASTISTLFHELTHIRTDRLGRDWDEGKIDFRHSDYLAASLYARARETYVLPDVDREAYESHPIEMLANAVGATAENAVRRGMKASVAQPERPSGTLFGISQVEISQAQVDNPTILVSPVIIAASQGKSVVRKKGYQAGH